MIALILTGCLSDAHCAVHCVQCVYKIYASHKLFYAIVDNIETTAKNAPKTKKRVWICPNLAQNHHNHRNNTAKVSGFIRFCSFLLLLLLMYMFWINIVIPIAIGRIIWIASNMWIVIVCVFYFRFHLCFSIVYACFCMVFHFSPCRS